MKCGWCGKEHNYYIYVEQIKKKIASAVCRKCEKEINKEVVNKVNTILKKRGKRYEKR